MNTITKEQYLKINMDAMIYNIINDVYFDAMDLKQAIMDNAKKSSESVSGYIPVTEQDIYNALNEQFIKMNEDHKEVDKWYNRFKKTYIHESLTQRIKEEYGMSLKAFKLLIYAILAQLTIYRAHMEKS